jgi:chromate reductase, NAD(P)H dehydrogenase (quinone)
MKEGLVDESGNIGDGGRAFLQTWMDRFVDWVRKHNN